MKPSKAARELAVLLSLEGFDKRGDFDEDKAAQRIQSALADLLTQAQYVVDAGPNEVTACQHFLAAALEPWQPCDGPKKAI